MSGSAMGNIRNGLACALCLALLCGCATSVQSGSDRPYSPKNDTSLDNVAGSGSQFDAASDRPPTAKTLYSMAEILATQGKDAECEFVLRRCISDYPQFTPAYNRLAELQMRQGRVHEAVDTLTVALDLTPRDPVLLNNMGMCLLVRKEYDQAMERFRQAAGVVPENKKYRANMATALGLLGRDQEALALWCQILPEPEARHNMEITRKAHQEQTPQAN
jgi:Flp pilus assembly protein TadD